MISFSLCGGVWDSSHRPKCLRIFLITSGWSIKLMISRVYSVRSTAVWDASDVAKARISLQLSCMI